MTEHTEDLKNEEKSQVSVMFHFNLSFALVSLAIRSLLIFPFHLRRNILNLLENRTCLSIWTLPKDLFWLKMLKMILCYYQNGMQTEIHSTFYYKADAAEKTYLLFFISKSTSLSVRSYHSPTMKPNGVNIGGE